MDSRVKDVVAACTRASDEERITFPEVVAKLAAVGIERYRADLMRQERVYFLPDGESTVERSRGTHGADAAEAFSAEGVARAVRAIRHGEIGYNAFCARIMAAGCVDYLVSIAGRRAIYFGRTGECHVERFPATR